MSQINEIKPEFETTFLSEPKTRRSALKSIASGMTVASLSGCLNIRKPYRKIKAYNKDQDDLIPGVPNYYATSMQVNDDVNGLLVTSYEGRPTKIDGNPQHPNNNGKSNTYIQAEIHQLYDPDRIQHHSSNNTHVTFSDIESKLSSVKKDESFAIVLPKSYSMLNQNLLANLKATYRNINIYYIDPVNTDKQSSAIKSSTGSFGYFDYKFSKASFILNFDHDLVGSASSRISSLKDYVDAHDSFKRISYSSSLSISDSKADAIVNSSILEQEHTIMYIARKLLDKYGDSFLTDSKENLNFNKRFVNVKKTTEIISNLIKYRSKSIVSVGELHSEKIHNVVLLINSILKNINRTIMIYPFSNMNTSFLNQIGYENSIDDLKKKLSGNFIKSILSFDVDLTRHLNDAEKSLKDINVYYLSLYKNKMSALSNVVISKTHFLEEWGILGSKEGHLSIQQPLINPLYGSKSITEVLLLLLNRKSNAYTYLTQFTKQNNLSFNRLKKFGVIKNRKSQYSLSINFIQFPAAIEATKEQLNLALLPSYQILDGRYSNNSWLLEHPDPISKITWGNAFYINSDFAKENDLVDGDVVKIAFKENLFLKGPVLILPGQNQHTITVNYGFGNVFNGAFSGYGISTDKFIPNRSYSILSIKKSNEKETLARPQMNHGFDEESLAASGVKKRIKNILQIKTQEEIDHPHDHKHHIHSLFKELEYKGKYQWGMSIDLNACMGCGACSIACQADNNIPVVGKAEVEKGREMSWLRIDRYFIENDAHETTINFMPLACVHCENAPCEQVCPVNATVHDDEGLNVMTYNRCIGTRYCANNCPYKVRRFNFFDWHQKNPQSVKKDRIHLFDYFKEPTKQSQKQFNPEVTVRMRGVMEKCTYCIHKIQVAKINAKVNNDESYIENLQSSCQQACATGAITFGDISNPNSLVSKERKSKRRYDLLQTELNTKPRTIYLAKIKKHVWKDSKKEASHGYH